MRANQLRLKLYSITFSWSMLVLLIPQLNIYAQEVSEELDKNAIQAMSEPVKPKSALPSENLGADDLIELAVTYCPELSKTFRVGSDGTLALPLIKTKLIAAGLTPALLGQLIQKDLVEERILTEPVVNVSVIEYRSHPVNVVGAVNRPLTFQATGRTTLLDALAQAGGLSSTAGGVVIVTKNQRSEVETKCDYVTVSILVKDLIRGVNPQLNIKLIGGEEIRVPEASKIYVAGNVRHPGLYAMQGDVDTTVIKAIALSQGLDQYSSTDAYIYRKKADGPDRKEVKIPLSRILAHKVPDVELVADDILYIPSSGGKRLASRILNQLAGFGQAAGTGILVYK